MELTVEQYQKIESYFPKQRGNVKNENHRVINALLYLLENGCKWRSLPKHFGNWATVYKRINRWCKAGVLRAIFEGIQKEGIMKVNVEFLALDSTCCKVHPDGCGALKKR
jgi:transposase